MIVDALCFLLGIYLAMRLVSAVYRFIDLWYRIRQFLPGILLELVLTLAVNLIIMLWLEDNPRSALIYGELFFAGFHVLAFWAGRIAVRFISR